MKSNSERRNRPSSGARRTAGALALLAGLSLAVPSCGSVEGGAGGPCTTSVVVEPFTQSSLQRIDLLLTIDNSRSMADKQLILAMAVPDLVRGLMNPLCRDPAGVPTQTQPQGPLEACPAGSKRESPPVLDIHIGVIDSSLGGHGSDSCSTAETLGCGAAGNVSNNDAAHLLSRATACGGEQVPTYKGAGFLAWDPAQMQEPPGTKDIGAIKIGNLGSPDVGEQIVTDTPGIVASLKDLVAGTGQVGCGYESQLESWYRFLIDPEPSKSILLQNGKAVANGIDDVLLKQRADFLRPDSLLAIILLTDENDCSVKETGQFYLATQQRDPSDPKKGFHLPRARQECATDPDNPCCRSCAQKADGCPPDDECQKSPNLSDSEDDINLRCWDQKRRFGIDFLYPIDRYTTALQSPVVPNRQGDLVPNPIFTDLDPFDDNTRVRDGGLVFFAGIVGVPWQDIARTDANGKPDLLTGLDLSGKPTGGFKSAEELGVKDESGLSTWDRILGDPSQHLAPKDPHMIESVEARPGLPPPGSPPDADPIHGHEYSIPKNDDLQYACVFDLPAPRDCSGNLTSCDCSDPMNDSPLCNPAKKTSQLRAKGYPGLRELWALRSVGSQGIVASICPAQTNDLSKAHFGYRPAIRSILDRLVPVTDGGCLPVTLTPSKDGSVPCLILEAQNTNGHCSCLEEAGRAPVPKEHEGLVSVAKSYPIAKNAGWDCFCEIPQAAGAALAACQSDASENPTLSGEAVNGWCYIDANTVPPTGNPEIVKSCPVSEKRLLRFVGAGAPRANATEFIACELIGHCPGGSP